MAKGNPISVVDDLSQDRGIVDFVDERVKSGRYLSAGDVVWAGLRLLEDHEAKITALQDALVAGEQSGRPQTFDFKEFKARKRAGRDQSES